ncbi:MAG: pyridoxamine 5'-phosphate oxidase family protein [Kouleothrix sp.]|nr:pyridoxamine 5'-phosphate oxidase family protein [Kouleothrix sp.]
MNYDDPAVLDIVRRSMVARIATLSRNGRPSVTPLYFVCLNGQIWLGTADWTLAARDVKADPRVSVLFEVEQSARDRRVARIAGRASVRTDAKTYAAYVLRVAFKYSLTPGQIRNTSAHLGLLLLRRRYHAQSAQKGQACVIDVTPEQADLLRD